jgi:hypothetical protein
MEPLSDGRCYPGLVRGWIEEQFFCAIPSLSEEELANVLATQGLLVEDTAMFIANVRVRRGLKLVQVHPLLCQAVPSRNFCQQAIRHLRLRLEPSFDVLVLEILQPPVRILVGLSEVRIRGVDRFCRGVLPLRVGENGHQ